MIMKRMVALHPNRAGSSDSPSRRTAPAGIDRPSEKIARAPCTAMFHVKQFLYRPAAVQFSARILDSEHIPNMRML
jgi:hypothetical protein